MDEEVLVVTSGLLHRLGHFCGFSTRTDDYLGELLSSANQQFLPRSRAEDDPNFKQLIPYVVLRWKDQLYCYARGSQGTEARLHAKLSFGIGGHVCRQDGVTGDAYRAGFERELAEEVAIDSKYRERIVGLVHDDRTPVGAVHLGIVHVLDLEQPAVRHRDPALADASFRPLREIAALRSRFESWSSLVLDHLLKEALPAREIEGGIS